jgi:hypothetical protein
MRSRSMQLVWAFALGVALLAGGCWNSAFGACTSGAAAAFNEIEQYGGMQLEPEDYPLGGRCAATFNSTDPIETVLAHYRAEWTAAGWTVIPSSPLASAPPSGAADFDFGGASASKNGMTYSVTAQLDGEETRFVLLVGPDQ